MPSCHLWCFGHVITGGQTYMGDPEDILGTGDVTTTEPRLLQQSKAHQDCG